MPSSYPLEHLVHRVASSTLGARVFSVVLHPVDNWIFKMSKGRRSLTAMVTGLPVYMLTSTGAKSGLERKVTLLGATDGEKVILIASNWGQAHYPAWYHNLKAHPRALLSFGGVTKTYQAHEASGAERQAAWKRATAIYPGYDNYMARTGGRIIPVMVLTPTDS